MTPRDFLTAFPRHVLAAASWIFTGKWLPRELYRRFAVAALAVILPIEALDLLVPPPLAKLHVTSAVVTDHRGAALRVFPVEDGKWRIRADLKQIDPDFIDALLAYEDKRFRSHAGVDEAAMIRAAASFASAGRIVSGGSTITMQTARLLEPRPRNIGSKLIEIIRATQLERRFTKDQILELYLTLAPYGGNLEGVRAASFAYFGREPDSLSPDQIAMLIALPQSPEARRPDLHPKAAIIARERVLSRLAQEEIVAADLAAESADYPAPQRRDFPSIAWHASEEAVTRSHAGGRPGTRSNKGARNTARRGDIRTTLDLSLQRELEALAARAAGPQRNGVQVAILALDLSTREVRASVGSAHRNGLGGWIDLTNRPRSPGSTLKPFIYGLAFDDGVATPDTRIADAPKRFASYRPDNFDRTFRGDVTVTEALQHSLNVPAVAALDAVGARRFAAALAFSGANLAMPLTADDDAGLAIALGGAGLTVRELAALYAALGDDGRALPILWLDSEAQAAAAKKQQATQVMSAQSARDIMKILAAAPTPAGRMPASLTQGAPVIAFKTGTSYGYRDAWAAGVGAGHVIIVWAGRADGAPRPGVTGREGALPVLFDAFDAVERALPNRNTGLGLREPDDQPHSAPTPLTRFERDNAPPHILFPPHKSEVWADETSHTFVLAAEGHGRLAWYADGQPVPQNAAGEPVWKPRGAGFYEISVVDAEGRTAKSTVRIRTPEKP